MAMNLNELQDAVKRIIAEEGFELVDFMVKGSKIAKILRVVIDHENGVSVGDCASVSHKLSDMLDIEQDQWGLESYRLEVSSPGIDRPLREEKDFRRNVGRDVGILYHSNDRVEKVEGTILGADESSVSLRVKEKTVRLDLPSIREAKITVKWK